MTINIIAALADNRCIGKNGQLPWHIPEDLKRFKELTTGSTVIMGRKTWESIPEKFRPLPNRKNIVLSRDTNYRLPKEVILFGSLEDALQSHREEKVFIIGGAEIYRQVLKFADKLYLTHVHQTIDGDAFFPEINPQSWQEVEREDHPDYSFAMYRRTS